MFPSSFRQQGLWFLDQLEGPSATYNAPSALRLDGPVDRTALGLALNDVVHRHESLRTVFRLEGGVVHQHVLPPSPDAIRLEITSPTDEEEAALHLTRLSHLPFDLAADPPIRAHLLPLGPERHILLLVLHHIATDGASDPPLYRDLAEAYRARAQGLPLAWDPLPMQYVDYAAWERDLLGDPDDPDSTAARQLAFWKRTLAGLPEEVTLPPDHPRPESASFRGSSCTVSCPATVHAGLERVARETGTTPFMVAQAATAVLLAGSGAGPDIPFGSTVVGRPDEALEHLVGYFTNTVVLRTDTSGNPSFRTLLGRVREADLAAWSHEELPFDQIVLALNPERSTGRHPIFQVSLAMEEAAQAMPDLPGITAGPEPVSTGTAKFDLTFGFIRHRHADGSPSGLDITVEYATDLYRKPTVQAAAERLAGILAEVTADPDTPIRSVARLTPREPGKRTPTVRPATDPPPAPPGPRAPRTAVERELARIFAEVLKVPEVSVDDNFFSLGGHSLLAVMLLDRTRDIAGTGTAALTIRDLYRAPTVARLAEQFATRTRGNPMEHVLTMRPGTGAPLFCVHTASGLSWAYSGLLRHLDGERPVIGLQSPQYTVGAETPADFGALADSHTDRMRAVQPHGPYHLLGWSFGGVLAHAIAVRLEAAGEEVATLAMMDSFPLPHEYRMASVSRKWVMNALLEEDDHGDRERALDSDGPRPGPTSDGELVELLRARDTVLGMLEPAQVAAVVTTTVENLAAYAAYETSGTFSGDVLYFRALRSPADTPPAESWAPYLAGAFESHGVDCRHLEMNHREPLRMIGELLNKWLAR
ncbi:condensation domain-containing protein [Streptomyces sp. rh34]|uniref:condensation domain-containing protein n=1 Tax=Streptomyces sp. rh34 TaxID=2034272 RepID=UPI000BF21524|nr:condensation domain-containing protein [Streptomyces sp. rh34]